MFVTDFFDDWLRQSRNRKHEICNRFIAGGGEGGNNHRQKNGKWSCDGTSCQKIHPEITLYFDKEKLCTVAIVSYRLEEFTKYFDQRISDGSAVYKSQFYYELTGFLRENLHHLRHQDQQQLFGSHLVKVAIGALNESDTAQITILEESRLRQHHRRHCHRQCVDSDINATDDDTSSSAVLTISKSSSSFYKDLDKLELILEICSLWGIEKMLDVLSINCMQKTGNHVFKKFGRQFAENRMKDCRFVVTPLVDGHFVSGYSVFRRANDNQETVFEREQEGRIVEYAVCSSVEYRCQAEKFKRKDDDFASNITGRNINGQFLPETCSNNKNKNNYSNNNDGDENHPFTEFSWSCDELSFANLELEWGDMGSIHEYTGQKISVRWNRTEVDLIPDCTSRYYINNGDEGEEYSSLHDVLSVFDMKLDWATTTQKTGISNFSIPCNDPSAVVQRSLFDFKIDVKEMEIHQVDDVTISFSGRARLLECNADFTLLVAAYARSLEASLIAHHHQIEMMRPLLRHEHDFLLEVQHAASLCPFSFCRRK